MPVMLMLFLGAFACEAYAVDRSGHLQPQAGHLGHTREGALDRWIVIHNLAEAKDTGIFHIEVIGHVKGRPMPGTSSACCNHMAITKHALKGSVTKAMNKGAVYPGSL
ncbi:MAG: DUF5086 domain-containing protein [Desulfobacterales bacterium]|nr:DUF5086 domain-containing protein [Desulfobacterales bacterium]